MKFEKAHFWWSCFGKRIMCMLTQSRIFLAKSCFKQVFFHWREGGGVRAVTLAIQLMLTGKSLMMNLFPLLKNCTVAMTIGSDIIGYKFNNKGNKPVPGSDSIIESFSCDPLALKSGHIFINIIAYKSQLYHNWLLESLGKWKVGSNDVKSGEWWRKRVKVAVRWVVREWWQQIAMLTQPTTSAMNLVILSPGCVLCPHQDDHAQWCWRGASPLSKRSENFYVDRFPCVPRLAQMACQPGWVWSGVPTTEIGQRPTLESEIPAGPDDTAIILGRISPRQCASLNLGDSLGIAPCLVWKSVEVSRL